MLLVWRIQQPPQTLNKQTNKAKHTKTYCWSQHTLWKQDLEKLSWTWPRGLLWLSQYQMLQKLLKVEEQSVVLLNCRAYEPWQWLNQHGIPYDIIVGNQQSLIKLKTLLSQPRMSVLPASRGQGCLWTPNNVQGCPISLSTQNKEFFSSKVNSVMAEKPSCKNDIPLPVSKLSKCLSILKTHVLSGLHLNGVGGGFGHRVIRILLRHWWDLRITEPGQISVVYLASLWGWHLFFKTVSRVLAPYLQ